MLKGQWARLESLILFGVLCTLTRTTRAEEKEIESGSCMDLTIQQIPVVDLSDGIGMPEATMRITQKYNTSYAEKANIGGKWLWGHDGLDLHEWGAPSGKNDVMVVMKGVVVVSDVRKGWGESEIVATRLNKFSEEIITHHYHHLHYDTENEKTTRRFGPCEYVSMGETLAKEGGTDKYATHLHFGIRRWANLAQLANALKTGGSAIYGVGYTYGKDSLLAKNLDPQGFLFDTFRDLPDIDPKQVAYGWARDYALDMREAGIELGMFNGDFGAGEPVKRREAARWLKIAARLQNVIPNQATFTVDMPKTDNDSVYVEALTMYPLAQPVINPQGGCSSNKEQFCPDKTIKRAEAIKMVILAFSGGNFLNFYQKYIWTAPFKQAISVLAGFQDVDPQSWYAPYVYYGLMLGIVDKKSTFKPGEEIVRAEMAKWVVWGHQLKEKLAKDKCDLLDCGYNSYCDPDTKSCKMIAECVPSETQQCEVGGGYDPCIGGVVCTPGDAKQQSCSGNGTQESVCQENCQWGNWGVCVQKPECSEGQVKTCGFCGKSSCVSGKYGACLGQGKCSPGEVVKVSCNGSGTQQMVCSTSCSWGEWSICSVSKVCAPSQQEQKPCNNGQGTQQRSCDQYGQWGQWSTCVLNQVCTPNKQDQKSCNNGLGTQQRSCDQYGQWGQWSTCVLNQVCTPNKQDQKSCNNGLG
ncbi:S-layer homology domain-containing protein, partial [Patescibacteria group bacterium]|nr:S-layer homology domain-containing protein [Patescibacteria group bacterium]